jgi:hypothetical protein
MAMKTFTEWLLEMGGAAGVYSPKIKIQGSWEGAPRGFTEPLSSVGDVKPIKKKKKKNRK